MRRRPRLVVTLAALPAALVVCEVVVRLGWVGPGPRPQSEGLVVQGSEIPGLLFEPAPGASRTTTFRDTRCSPSRTVIQRTNRLALRGPEVAVPKPPEALRILCVGDSHTFGDGVADDETWPAYMAAELARRHLGRRIEVVNAGVNGYDTEQEVLFVRHRLLDLEPDFIVLQYFINDVGSRDREAAAAREHHVHWAHPRRGGPLAQVRRRSALVDAWCESVFRRHHLADMAAWLEHDYVENSERWQFTRARLTDLADVARDAGVGFGVALYPLMAAAPGGLASDRAFAEVARFLAAEGIAHTDASPRFAGRDLVALRIAPGDMHAGAEANRLFADAVADWLADLGYPAGAGPP